MHVHFVIEIQECMSTAVQEEFFPRKSSRSKIKTRKTGLIGETALNPSIILNGNLKNCTYFDSIPLDVGLRKETSLFNPSRRIMTYQKNVYIYLQSLVDVIVVAIQHYLK